MQKISFLLMLMLTMMFLVTSCGDSGSEKDLCENVTCQNEGTCNKGKCECKDGFEGDNCENKHERPFLTTWKTDNEGVSEDNQVKIPVDPYINSNYNVDCDNDGVFEVENQKGGYTCTYDKPGIYTIRIMGNFPSFHFDYTYDGYKSDNNKLLSVEQWGTQKWTSMNNAFLKCSNFILNAKDSPALSNVADMSGMFNGAKAFNQDISSWNVDNVNKCRHFDLDTTSWVLPKPNFTNCTP